MEESLVIQDLRRHLIGTPQLPTQQPEQPSSSSSSSPCDDDIAPTTSNDQVALPVAAIKSLLGVIQRTKSETMMGLEMELKKASEEMLSFANDPLNSHMLGGRSHIALASGCELFLKYITRCFLELPDFNECMAQILSRGQRFSDISLAARDRIAATGKAFIQPGARVLTHGWSSVVSSLLIQAAEDTHFEVIVLEGRPDASGAKAAKNFARAGIPATVVLDSAMAYVMERVDLVIVGAEGVVENGGIINKVGTYAMAIAAKELGKPFYVAAESFKFARLYPLNQSDLPVLGKGVAEHLNFVDTACWLSTGGMVGSRQKNGGDEKDEEHVPGLVSLPEDVKVENVLCDYTPAKYITLLLTDLGVLTPSAVSDELIRLYQ
jgi:Translation initiation factor 2B subunit, eIF-2B alpha/beta/delta family